MAVLLYILSVNSDSIGVGISYGLRKIHISFIAGATCAGVSALCFAIAFFAGSFLSAYISPNLSKALASIVLFLLGIWIILNSFTDTKYTRKFSIRPLGITILILRDPVACDFDNSSKIDIREAIYLAIALSLDSVAVGFGAGLSGLSAWYLPILIGITQFLFLKLGKIIGEKLRTLKIPHKIWTTLSGLILILLAIVHII